VPSNEDKALKRLADLKWKSDGTYIVMDDYFNAPAAEALKKDLSDEARSALGFVLIANGKKVMMRKEPALALFRLEGLALDIVNGVGNGRCA
jgi:hypothetical protein